MEFSAIILAGGKSSRMGFDKQYIKIGDKTIIEIIIDNLKPLFDEIIIVTNNPEIYKNYGLIITKDIYKGIGPIAGFHSGLLESSNAYNYIIACDMPFTNINYIEYMKRKIEKSKDKVDAITTSKEGMRETMNAFYSRNIIDLIEKRIKDNKKSILGLLDVLNVFYIQEEIAKTFSPDWDMFTNLNTQEDLKKI